MQKQLVKSTGALSSSNAVQLSDFLSRLIFQASVATLFNEDAANDKDLYSSFVTFDQQLPLAAAGISVSNFSGARKAREVLINACKKYTTDNCELICKRREYFQEVGLPVQDAAAFTLAMLWASVGNTMPVTFWLVFYLLSDTALLSRAKEEVHSAALESIGQELSQEQLNDMVFIDACITETLRLTSGSLIMRFVKKQCDLTMASGATYRFRKDDRVGLCPALTHLDEEIYPDAKIFRPDRWLNGDTLEERQMSSIGRIPCFKGGKAITKYVELLS
jgi:cytochrome P450